MAWLLADVERVFVKSTVNAEKRIKTSCCSPMMIPGEHTFSDQDWQGWWL